MVAATSIVVVYLFVGFASWHTPVGEGVKTHVVMTLGASVGFTCALFAIRVASQALVFLLDTYEGWATVETIPVEVVR